MVADRGCVLACDAVAVVLVPHAAGGQIAITAIRGVARSILGYAGLVSLGHAAYFVSVRTAGLVAKVAGPFSGLLIGGAAAGLFGHLTGYIVVPRLPGADHDHPGHRPAL
jgi:ABC-type branched-subunit amino acid transport system permease subunit